MCMKSLDHHAIVFMKSNMYDLYIDHCHLMMKCRKHSKLKFDLNNIIHFLGSSTKFGKSDLKVWPDTIDIHIISIIYKCVNQVMLANKNMYLSKFEGNTCTRY